MISFYCQTAGYKTHVRLFLKVMNNEYVLEDVTYKIDGGQDKIGNIDLKMSMNHNGSWKRNCKLILAEPLIKSIYPGNTDKTKTFTKINIPKEAIYQIQSFLSHEFLERIIMAEVKQFL